MSDLAMAGPLSGIRIVEFAAIGPIPFGALLLSNMGADIIRIARPGADVPVSSVLNRRSTITVDLKKPEGRDLALSLIGTADAVLEGFRPGIMERLGLGPDPCQTLNRRLVYARVTGWGQTGPLAPRAGHDINYIALSGALHAIGDAHPVPPLNLVGDYAGGSMFMVFGLLCAILEAQRSGQGQVIDCAMTDGATMLMTAYYDRVASGTWIDQRSSNRIDGGSPYYAVYETADARHVAVGAVEEAFWRQLLLLLKIDADVLPSRDNRANWPAIRQTFADIFRMRTRDEWVALAEGTDACVTPVLSMSEAPDHPHHRARHAFQNINGVSLPAPAPRLSRTPALDHAGRELAGQSAIELLMSWGIPAGTVEVARSAHALA